MAIKGYKDFDEEMILRDYLAYDRTRLALARTFLSFARTALGLLASGAGLIIIRNEEWCRLIGTGIIIIAATVLVAGVIYCFLFKKKLDGRISVIDNIGQDNGIEIVRQFVKSDYYSKQNIM